MSAQDTRSGSPLGSSLGKNVIYESHYNPALLYPIPRAEKRAELGITNTLPFVGMDIWNAYELSWLNPKGKPMVALATFTVPAHSPCIIESKSLKLYLNSYNQAPLENAQIAQARIASDLSQAAGAEVLVQLMPIDALSRGVPKGVPNGVCIDDLDIEIDTYTHNLALLATRTSAAIADQTLYSHLLKSNCLVTGQPDWGMVAIRYSGPKIVPEALLRYIISFREHNEFHEQCVERIFSDIQHQCRPTRLAVWARYTRRGGLDINPIRATDTEWAAVGNLAEVRQ